MFDFHLHSSLSHDSTADAAEMIAAAERNEIYWNIPAPGRS